MQTTNIFSPTFEDFIDANVYTVSHQFIYDELFHLQQQPRVDQDGRPILNAAGTHANQVYFIQPFPKLLDHNAISTNF